MSAAAAYSCPVQPITTGFASSASDPATGRTVASDSRVPCTSTSLQPVVAARAVGVDHDREQDVIELIGQLQDDVGEPLRDGPDRDRAGHQHGRNHDRVGGVVRFHRQS